MKKLYSRISIPILFFGLGFVPFDGHSQTCPNSGTPGTTAFDTTIAFGSGIVLTDVKFPKFDPQNGMVTCVKLCVTIKGIIDTVALENYTNAPQTGSYTYTRKDTIRGPGISTYLTSSPTNLTFGPFALAATNGVFGSGPDFYSAGPDTVLTKVLCSTISDSTTIVQFYGVNDSVTYNYAIDADAIGVVTGGSSLAFVLSSALVNFHFEYCTCPAQVLPLNIRQFSINKISNNKVELNWSVFDNNDATYHYETEVSRDGHKYIVIGKFPKNSSSNNIYRHIYAANPNEKGVFLFRIKQVYSNGYTRFSEVREINLENSTLPKFNFYPNPSNGIVGIKFDNNFDGKLLIQIFNMQAQTVLSKEIYVSGSSYCQIATLQKGVYWLKVKDVTGRLSCVNQLLIK